VPSCASQAQDAVQARCHKRHITGCTCRPRSVGVAPGARRASVQCQGRASVSAQARVPWLVWSAGLEGGRSPLREGRPPGCYPAARRSSLVGGRWAGRRAAQARAWLTGTQTLSACASGRAAFAARHGNPLALALAGRRREARPQQVPPAAHAWGSARWRARAGRPPAQARSARIGAPGGPRGPRTPPPSTRPPARARWHPILIPSCTHGTLDVHEVRCCAIVPQTRSRTAPLRLCVSDVRLGWVLLRLWYGAPLLQRVG